MILRMQCRSGWVELLPRFGGFCPVAVLEQARRSSNPGGLLSQPLRSGHMESVHGNGVVVYISVPKRRVLSFSLPWRVYLLLELCS